MGFGRKNNEEVVKEVVKVWDCESDTCNCWIRDNFKSGDKPKCPICGSEMVLTTRELQVVNNNSIYSK
ncbi:cold-inducible protein YdjO-related protein [Bacillus sp. B1-b2]|uniref:cold-inducible protein YdjO-related protein n=1 Tax=Bacillus sp. B1-b2 TaxID=2653201 RepID=UPI001869F3E7|nr:cold-inducible protein YdjO-related protein [Bacillus sp. B1-b2]